MAWKIEYDNRALKDIKKLDRSVQNEIYAYIDERIVRASEPRQYGKPLVGNKRGLWRYRMRDYRIICQIQEQKLVVLVVAVGHRSAAYD